LIGLAGGLNTYGYVDATPLLLLDPFSWFGVGGPAPKGTSTIVCDGEGGISVQFRPMDPLEKKCGIAECTYRHEDSHRRDALKQKPSICVGKKPGLLVGASSEGERRATEYNAYGETINCLKEKLKDCKDFNCKNLYTKNINFYERVRNDLK
jgi:hypothetical protein